jgi:Flp pilus assembly protein TadG
MNVDAQRNPSVRPACHISRRGNVFSIVDRMASLRKMVDATLTAARAFARREDGGPAAEFATLLPLFIGLLFVIAQMGLYFYYSASLYYVTQAASRQILTGSVANQSLTAAQFRSQIVCPLLPGSMSCSNVITNVQVIPEASQPGGFYSLMNYVKNTSSTVGYTMTGLAKVPMDNSSTNYCIGSPGAIVTVEVYYAMPVLGLSWFLADSSTYNGQSVMFISATAAFKNEPFTTSYAGC